MQRYALPLLLLPLAAHANGERLPYFCDNGKRIEISYLTSPDGRPQAILHLADSAITLPQVPSASGVLFRAADIRLQRNGDEAMIEDAGQLQRCRQGSAPPLPQASAKPAPSSFLDISGRVFYFSRTALPTDAVLIVRVQDSARRGRPARILAEQQIELTGQPVPISFQTTVDRDLIGKEAHITASARIEYDGKVLFASAKSHPALNKGQAINVDMQLQQARQ